MGRKWKSESDLETVYELEDGTIEVDHKTDAKIPPMHITDAEVTTEDLAALEGELRRVVAGQAVPQVTRVTYTKPAKRWAPAAWAVAGGALVVGITEVVRALT